MTHRSFLVVALFSLILTVAVPSHSRELAVPAEDMVKVEIATLALSVVGTPVLLLREPNARKAIPIMIGTAEAEAILRAREQLVMPRPMTHDLFSPIFNALNAELTRVFIDDLANNTFMGALELRVAGAEEPLLIDSRPSDALAIAIRTGSAIYVSQRVLNAAADIEYHQVDDQPVTALGITVEALTGDLREALDLPEQAGVLVVGVVGPAQARGLAPGDMIVGVNDESPESPMHFLELVRNTPEGEQAGILYWQDGEEQRISVPTDVPDPQPQRYQLEEGISL